MFRFLFSLLASSASLAAAPPVLWYEQPAKHWMLDALPIGNGNLGGMIFGHPAEERVQFNEDSLWTGDESDTGAYQGFGELLVRFEGFAAPVRWSVSGASPSGEGIDQGTDGDPSTKWCVENHGQPVAVELQVGQSPVPLSSYVITSGNDMPDRDPMDWVVQGSSDGKSWQTIDERSNEPTWEKRGAARTFRLATPSRHSHYRFVFSKVRSATHFQVADIAVDAAPAGGAASDYRRELNLIDAVHSVCFRAGGVTFRREAFSTYKDKVMAIRFTADQPGKYSGEVEMKDAHNGRFVTTGDTIVFSGHASGARQPKTATDLAYEARLKIVPTGGAITTEGNRILFKGCDSFILLLAADTNYSGNRESGWKQDGLRERLVSQIDRAAAKPYAQLLADHTADFSALMNRMTFTLPVNSNSSLPTDRRLRAYQNDRSDRDFESLVFHYARYLMASCSRDGSMPANLQGLWNPLNNPPWRCDYHSDVNMQMNYWFVDQCNLSDCFLPYAVYHSSVRAVRHENTVKRFGKVRGWATRSENGIFGGSSYLWVPGDAAWLAQNLWDHYAYTRDKTYLADHAYPILKELCEFWDDFLIRRPDGTLVSPKSVSPEHGPELEGNSYEQQLVHDLFTNFIEASSDLGVDPEFRAKVAEMRGRLLGPKIGKWGQLQEWEQDIDDPKDTHRHLSHLIAVYPGRQIAPTTAPELAKAAAVSLNARGDAGTGWSMGWKMLLWARLHDGDRAHSFFRNSLTPTAVTTIVMDGGGVYDNLLMAHPPFQIDANFAFAAACGEMLMQSHLGEIHLLPALPKAWPDGKITGLKARGNHTVDLIWKDGKLYSATITSPEGFTPKIRIGTEGVIASPSADPRLKLVSVSR